MGATNGGRVERKGSDDGTRGKHLCDDSAELRTDGAMNVNVTHGCNCYQQFAQQDVMVKEMCGNRSLSLFFSSVLLYGIN